MIWLEISVAGQSYGREGPRSPNSETQRDALSLLLAEIRSLRIQLEKSLHNNNALRLKLEEQLIRHPESPSQSPRRTREAVIRQLSFSEGKGTEDDSSVGSARGNWKKKNADTYSPCPFFSYPGGGGKHSRWYRFLLKALPTRTANEIWLVGLPCIFKKTALLFSFAALENERISSGDLQVVDQLEEKLNAINKFATDVYKSIISSAQVTC